MKKLSILLIIGTAIMGWYDGGDMTAVLVLAVLLCPVIFERKECVKGEKGKRHGYQRGYERACVQKSFEKTW